MLESRAQSCDGSQDCDTVVQCFNLTCAYTRSEVKPARLATNTQLVPRFVRRQRRTSTEFSVLSHNPLPFSKCVSGQGRVHGHYRVANVRCYSIAWSVCMYVVHKNPCMGVFRQCKTRNSSMGRLKGRSRIARYERVDPAELRCVPWET